MTPKPDSALSRRRQTAFGLSSLTLLILLTWGWRRAEPPGVCWSDIRAGDGAVLSLAPGHNPDGAEVLLAGGYLHSDDSGHDLRVVCYQANTGRILWEAREDWALPNMSKTPSIAIDPHGDVIVGWDYWAVGSGQHPLITKLSGADGRTLWDWKVAAVGPQSGHLAVPQPDDHGGVWVSGITEVASYGEYRRFVALLDDRDGGTLWKHDINFAQDANDRRAVIYPLKDGAALAVSPPKGGEGLSPWLIQRLSRQNGVVIWEQKFQRENDRNLPGLQWVVDEAHHQIVVFFSTVAHGSQHLEVVSLQLSTGIELWRSTDKKLQEMKGWVDHATLSDSDEILVWSSHQWESTHTNWLHWSKAEGLNLWLPDRAFANHEQPLQITVSGNDGTVRQSRLVAHQDERINAILSRNVPPQADAIVLRSMFKRAQTEPWRVVRLYRGALWQRLFWRDPSGPLAALDFPDHAVITDSGRIVIAGDPRMDGRSWQIRVW